MENDSYVFAPALLHVEKDGGQVHKAVRRIQLGAERAWFVPVGRVLNHHRPGSSDPPRLLIELGDVQELACTVGRRDVLHMMSEIAHLIERIPGWKPHGDFPAHIGNHHHDAEQMSFRFRNPDAVVDRGARGQREPE